MRRRLGRCPADAAHQHRIEEGLLFRPLSFVFFESCDPYDHITRDGKKYHRAKPLSPAAAWGAANLTPSSITTSRFRETVANAIRLGHDNGSWTATARGDATVFGKTVRSGDVITIQGPAFTLD